MVTAQQGPRLGKGLVPGSTTSAEAASTTASARRYGRFHRRIHARLLVPAHAAPHPHNRLIVSRDALDLHGRSSAVKGSCLESARPDPLPAAFHMHRDPVVRTDGGFLLRLFPALASSSRPCAGTQGGHRSNRDCSGRRAAESCSGYRGQTLCRMHSTCSKDPVRTDGGLRAGRQRGHRSDRGRSGRRAADGSHLKAIMMALRSDMDTSSCLRACSAACATCGRAGPPAAGLHLQPVRCC